MRKIISIRESRDKTISREYCFMIISSTNEVEEGKTMEQPQAREWKRAKGSCRRSKGSSRKRWRNRWCSNDSPILATSAALDRVCNVASELRTALERELAFECFLYQSLIFFLFFGTLEKCTFALEWELLLFINTHFCVPWLLTES